MSDTVIVHCPTCRQPFSIDPATMGQQFKCSNCGNIFIAANTGVGQLPPMMNYGTGNKVEKTSPVAIASLVCSLAICVPFNSLAAIILGVIGIVQTGPGKAKGRGMAIAGLVIGCIAMVALPAILLPALNQARNAANRAKCASNMGQIGKAISQYQAMNNQEYPPSLTALMTQSHLPGSYFVCPGSNDTPATHPSELESGGHCSFIYVYPGPGRRSAPSSRALLFENASDHGNQGTNILLPNGSVSWFTSAAAHQYTGR